MQGCNESTNSDPPTSPRHRIHQQTIQCCRGVAWTGIFVALKPRTNPQIHKAAWLQTGSLIIVSHDIDRWTDQFR